MNANCSVCKQEKEIVYTFMNYSLCQECFDLKCADDDIVIDETEDIELTLLDDEDDEFLMLEEDEA